MRLPPCALNCPALQIVAWQQACSNPSHHRIGPCTPWFPLQTAVLLAADVLCDASLAMEAVDAFEYHGVVPQVRCGADWPAACHCLDAGCHALVPLNSAGFMCLSNFLTTSGWLQMESAQLNAVYTRLLEALYTTATSEAQAASTGADRCPRSINLDHCTRIADAWQRQAGAWSAKVTPQTAEAYEALAVVRVLGQQDYSGERHRLGCLAAPTGPHLHCECIDGSPFCT